MTSPAYPETIAPIDGGCHGRRNAASAADEARDLALMRSIKAGDFDTRQQLVTSNLLHVLRSNRCYGRSGTGIFDLLKAGEHGLVHALENFEREGHGRFSAYAASCIRLHIEHALNPRPPAPARMPRNAAPGIRPQCT